MKTQPFAADTACGGLAAPAGTTPAESRNGVL